MKGEHKNKEISYGQFISYGCKGIGGGLICVDCMELLEYELDYESCLENEIRWYERYKPVIPAILIFLYYADIHSRWRQVSIYPNSKTP